MFVCVLFTSNWFGSERNWCYVFVCGCQCETMGEGAGSLGRDFGQELLFVCLVFLSLFGGYITESEYNILTISYPFVSLRSPVLAVHLTMNLRCKCCAHFF